MTDTFKGNLSLFPVREKRKEKSPDYTGTIELPLDQAMALAEWLTAQPGETAYNGNVVVKIDVAGWKNVSQNGMAYVKGAITPPRPKQQQAADPIDQEIPF